MESNTKRRKVSHPSGGGRTGVGPTNVATASPFILQTEELLKEVKLDTTTLEGVDTLLHTIKDAIDGIGAQEPLPIAEATRKFQKRHRIEIPYPDPAPTQDAPYKLSYAKPASYNVVGSYVSKTMVKSQAEKAVDMIVQMPEALFQEKDYLNMRYFYRRAYYVATIAAGVRKEMGSAVDLEFELLNENMLLPILVIRPKQASSKAENEGQANGKHTHPNYAVRIIPCAPEGLFPKTKLQPSACCNRSTEDAKTSGSTPFYNSTLKAEETFVAYLRILTHAKNECNGFTDACILGRIWLQQRGLGSSLSKGGFGHFEWAIVVALLLQTDGRHGQPALSSSLSSTELFKAVVQFLASTDFLKKPFLFGVYKPGNDTARETGPVMFDPARELNVLYKMSPWSASLLRLHAGTTLELLNDNLVDQFEPTFITKTDLPLQMFDSLFEVAGAAVVPKAPSPDRRGPTWDSGARLYNILRKAFKSRASLIHIQCKGQSPWPLGSSHPRDASSILVGVVFDPANMGRPMEYGPSAEAQQEAVKFRQFWGEKSELRRFKDGSILECVEWTNKTAAGICEEMTRYILGLHVGLVSDDFHFHDADLSSIVSLSPLDREAFDTARRSFQTLEHDIRSLEGMPLSVRQLSPISPELRSSSIRAPTTGYHKGSVQPMDVMLYFEASSRWPDNLVAIQEAKIEFLLDIDRRLRAAKESITSSLGRDNAGLDIENLVYLDIVYDTGAVFRMRVHCDLEETLLERQAKNKTLDPHTRTQAEETLSNFRWLYTHLPLHTQTISTSCTRLIPLSSTIRLVKHWFNAHKLSGQISEELIELIVLHVFLQPHPWRAPTSVMTGFLRTLLFLSRWDWRDEPLIVDLSDDISGDDRTTIHKRLEAWRVRDPNMHHTVLFVATSHDQSGLAYTRSGPSKLVATRMTKLARAACKLVKEQGISLEAKLLFQPSLRDYDVLIHLSTAHVKRLLRESASESGTKHSQFKNLDERTGKVPLPPSRHPASVLLEELKTTYEDTLIFFHGSPNDAIVGAIWQPKLHKQAFRVGLPYNFHRVDEEEDMVEVNRPAVLLEIARIGGDMIKQIEEVEG